MCMLGFETPCHTQEPSLILHARRHRICVSSKFCHRPLGQMEIFKITSSKPQNDRRPSLEDIFYPRLRWIELDMLNASGSAVVVEPKLTTVSYLVLLLRMEE
jgi:hypothetical protein